MKLTTQPYKGARDFYPSDKRLQNYIFNVWRTVAVRYGYEEYSAPLIELTDLYRAKSGEEIVDHQTYRFEDRGGRDVALRPEMTPSVARMVAAKRQELSYPLRWYSIPVMWRYERPQHGRMREHWQLNADIFGVNTIDAELEMISLVHDIMSEFGATNEMYSIKINSRKLTAMIMADYLQLDPAQSHRMVRLLDKKEKIDQGIFEAEAQQIFNDDEDRLKKLRELIKAKSMGELPDQIKSAVPIRPVQLLFTHLRDNHINNVAFDVSLMRGFDYYTDIVFEVYDNHPENSRSLFGGGRFDGLVGMFGVEPVGTVGFGMGDVTIQDFIEAHGLTPELRSTTDIYIIVVGDYFRQAQGVARILRQSGANVAIDISDRKVDKQIKVAVKKQIPYALFVGEQELSSESFTLKDLSSQEEKRLGLHDIAATIHPKQSS